jgi:hypothetical protein
MLRTYRKYLALFAIKGSLVLILVIGSLYVTLLLARYDKDTTHITNGAFAITASLASLCFSCSRALNAGDEDRDRFTYAGERLLHASILLITASILKYAVLAVWSTGFGQSHSSLVPALTIPIGVSVTFLFTFALLNAHTGLRVCGNLLWDRANRYDDHDKIV